MVDPHYCLLAACCLFIKGRSRFIFAAYEHIQDCSVPWLFIQGTQRKIPRGQIHSCCQQPGNLEWERAGNKKSWEFLPQQVPPELKEQLRAQKCQTRPSKALIFVSVVLPGLSPLHCSGIPAIPFHHMGVLLSSWRLISLFCD